MAEKLGIYRIVSPSGRIYIGQSWNIDQRFYQYLRLSGFKNQTILYNSLKKYGQNLHKFEIIHQLPNDIEQDILDIYEQVYIDAYKNSGFSLMNIRDARSRGKHSEETKRKMSSSKMGNKVNLGRVHSIESKQKMSDIKLGKSHPNMGKYNIKRISQFTINNIWKNDFDSISDASKALGIDRRSISECVNGRNKTAKGFIFKEYARK